MSDDKIWTFRIGHILNAIAEIESFMVGHTYETFLKDTKTLRAVERNIEIIGEAASKIPEHVRVEHPDIPWNGMKGIAQCHLA